MLKLHARTARKTGGAAGNRAPQVLAPGPGVAEPELRKDMESGRFRAAIHGCDLNENVFDICFGVLDKNIEVAVVDENSGIEQFEFGLTPATAPVFFNEKFVREFSLRILVQHAHVAVRWSGIEIKVALLYILTVIALVSRQPEEALFEDRIAAVPER